MTTINAIRFNRYEGAFVGDECTSSGDMKIYSSDKILPSLPDAIVNKYGTVVAVGTTGSCSMGDNIKMLFKKEMKSIYETMIDKQGKTPSNFLNLKEMGHELFNLIMNIKNTMISEKMEGTYGFSLPEFIQGSYNKSGKKYDIKNKEIISDCVKWMTWQNDTDEVSYIFRNAGLFGGYDDRNGFQIYYFDLMEGYWHPVQTCYYATGSGRHSVNPHMYGFVEQLLLDNRRGDIDRVEGIIALISAINAGVDHEVGVEGYFNIILVNGKEEDYSKRMIEINDDRAFLITHIVRALDGQFIDFNTAYNLVDSLLYKNETFDEVYASFFQKVNNAELLIRKLRGYKLLPRRNWK